MAQRFLITVVFFVSLTVGCNTGDQAVTQGGPAKPDETVAIPAEKGGEPAESQPAESQLRILSWNVESEGSDPDTIAEQLAEFSDFDIIALSEVLPSAAEQFQNAFGDDFDGIVTRSGYNDRLQILFNTKRFKLVRRLELDEINDDRHRSPLVAHLQDNRTDQEILVMNNHLARGNAEYRTTQASQLVEWARQQSMPIVAVGDYNFDYEFKDDTGNDGFRAMLNDNVFKWVKPEKLVDSNWYDPEPDGKDNFPGSLLDFAFVAGPATEWNAVCNVIVRPNDFPDDKTTSDHRPFELIIDN